MNFKVRKLHVIFIGYIKGYLVGSAKNSMETAQNNEVM